MKGLFIFFILLVASVIYAKRSVKRLPDMFYGKFRLDHAENFDEYLAATGYNAVIRIVASTAIFTKEFRKRGKSGKFDYSNLVEASKNFTEEFLKPNNLPSRKYVVYKNITLGRPFIAEGIDSTMHKIMFHLVGDVLHEGHNFTEKGVHKEQDIEYSFTKKDGKEYLLVELRAPNVVAKRYYKRI